MRLNAISETLKRYDWSFFATILAIFGIGLLNLYSATHANEAPAMANLYKTQFLWFTIAMGVAILVSFIGPKTLFKASYVIYGINVLLLLLVLVMGRSALGAQRWLVLGPISIQPSEMMKLSLVLALGRWFTRSDPDKPLTFSGLIVPAIIALIPALLTVVQPDLGTGMLLLFIFATMVFYRRLSWKIILMLALVGALGGGAMYKYGLKDYQKKRIVTFIDPTQDARGSGYNAIQSEIAIGSGRIWGKGFRKSSQASLQYLPENHTDFAFSIFNEEHGLIGSIILIVLYSVLFLRIVWLSTVAVRVYHSMVCIGILGIFFWHTFINMGMVMGLMPIVGIPLPLVSYGGSILLTLGICIGILTSISKARNLF